MRSLRSRLTFTHALVGLIAVLIVATLVAALVQNGFDRLALRQASAEAASIADQLGELYGRRASWRTIEPIVRRRFPTIRIGDSSTGRRIQILDAADEVIYDNAGPVVRRLRPMQSLASAPIVVAEQTVGRVLVGESRNALSPPEQELRRMIRVSLLGGSLAAGIVALIVGLISASQVTRPLRSLTDAAQRLAAGRQHEPLAVPADRELAELATSFNAMASELEHQQHLRRQQIADIAHELRTPLSVLRLQLESLEDGVEQPTPDLLASLGEEARLLTRLVDDLRLLSLADAGQLSLALGPVDAGSAMTQTLTSTAARARQQGIALQVDLPTAPLSVVADPQRLAQILLNLVENALRYTPPGGTVTLEVQLLPELPPAPQPEARPAVRPQLTDTQREPAVVFAVRDSGPGIAPEDVERMFERFWRADRARARETGGSGLGLAIVQRLVTMQYGRVWAESRLGQGTTIFVALPATCQ